MLSITDTLWFFWLTLFAVLVSLACTVILQIRYRRLEKASLRVIEDVDELFWENAAGDTLEGFVSRGWMTRYTDSRNFIDGVKP